MNSLPYGQIRHIFSFLLGCFLLQFTLGVQWIHIPLSSLIVYVMLLIFPRKLNTTLVPGFALFYLVFGHLHRQYINYLGWDLDFTGAQMVLTQKLHMIAFNLYDGQVLASGKENRAAKKCSQFALPKLPSLIEYLGYTCCFSNVLSGPVSEFSIYQQSCDGSLLYDKMGKPRGKIPSNVWPSLAPLLSSLACLMIFVGLGAHFPLLDPTDPQNNNPIVITPEFLENPWPYRFFYLWMGLLVVRQKYYFAWKNSEGANNVWYAGFEGFDEKGKAKGWDNSKNVGIFNFEFATSIQTLSKEWNKRTSLWLTRYVYIRTNGSLLAVYSMSAFWHGFYPGYYLFFLSVPLMTFTERLAKKKLTPLFGPSNIFYNAACWVATSFCAEYMVSAFVMLALEWSWKNWKGNYFFGHAVCIIGYSLLSQLKTPKKKET